MVFSKRAILLFLMAVTIIQAAQNPIYQSATIRPGFTHRALWNYKNVGAIMEWAEFTEGKQTGYSHYIETHKHHFFAQIAYGIKEKAEISFTPLHIEPWFADNFLFNFFMHYHLGFKLSLMKTELPFDSFNQLSLAPFIDIGMRGGYVGVALSVDRFVGKRSTLELSLYPSFNVHRYFYNVLLYSVRQNSLDIPLGVQYSFGRVVKLAFNAGVTYSIEIGDYSYSREYTSEEYEILRWTHKSSPLCFTAGGSLYLGSKRIRARLRKENKVQ